MIRKGKIAAIAASVLLGASLCVADSGKVTVDGVVTPMVTMDISYGLDQMYKGFIDYVMPAGTFFSGPVYDSRGVCLKDGDVLAMINPDYAKLQNEADRLAYEDSLDQYNRNIASGEAVSKRALSASKIDMLQAKAKFEMSKKIVDEVCTLRARFDGYVNQVKFSGGWAQGLPATLNVSQLDPIYITVPAGKIPPFYYNTPITVYPRSDRGGQPVGYIQGRTVGTPSGDVMILVNNKPVPPPVDLKGKDGKAIPVIKTWCPLIEYGALTEFSYDKDSLVVSKHSLFGSNGDYYVWMVEGSKCGVQGQGMNYLNKVKKVKVETDGKIMSIPSYVGMVSFTPKDKVETVAGTILLSSMDCPADLKDGDTVCLYAGMYSFMPGDKVKIEIGPAAGPIQ